MTAVSAATDARSQELFAEAQELIPGGVNSPVRAFRAVGGAPRFIERGEGPYVYDADGNQLIDYVLSYGPLVLGHAHPEVVAAITAQAAKGTSYGAPTALETRLAELVIAAMPALRNGALRQLRHGSDDERAAPRSRRHGPCEDNQDGWRLPRPRGLPAQ